MRRDLDALCRKEFDVVVVGAGIFGACAAWEATQRGLSVAVLERRDFGHATSANHLKMVHGGIRYVQHGDVCRVRESSRERRAFLRIAPHLVEPLPIVIPTYGHGMQGKGVLRLGCLIYDLLTLDRNLGIKDPERRIPWARGMSRSECLEAFPDLDQRGLTGAVLFSDAQMYNPPRLTLAFLRSAVGAGAQAANYVEVNGFLRRDDQITGVTARDLLGGEDFQVRAKVVLNAAGPWAGELLKKDLDVSVRPPLTFSRDACFIVPRRLTGRYALAVQGRTADPDALVSRPHRHLFMAPWREYTLVGVWHVVHQGPADQFTVTDDELQEFLDEVNQGYPSLKLSLDDVSMWNAGLTLFGENKPGVTDLSYGKRSRIIDHGSEHGLGGLVTLVGVRFTTARGIAVRAVNTLLRRLGRSAPRSKTAVTPIFGGDVDDFGAFRRRQCEQRPESLSPEVMDSLLRNHGTAYRNVLRYVEENPDWSAPLGDTRVIKAEVIHAIREEMARTLADVVFRRTDLGTGANPGEAALASCAELAATELQWDEATAQRHLDEVKAVFARARTF